MGCVGQKIILVALPGVEIQSIVPLDTPFGNLQIGVGLLYLIPMYNPLCARNNLIEYGRGFSSENLDSLIYLRNLKFPGK